THRAAADASGCVVLVAVLHTHLVGLLNGVLAEDAVADGVQVGAHAPAEHVHVGEQLERNARQELHVDVAELQLLVAEAAADVGHARRRPDGFGVGPDLLYERLCLVTVPGRKVTRPLHSASSHVSALLLAGLPKDWSRARMCAT